MTIPMLQEFFTKMIKVHLKKKDKKDKKIKKGKGTLIFKVDKDVANSAYCLLASRRRRVEV